MLAPDSQDENWHSVKSHRQRLVLFEPEKGWWIHAVIANEISLVQLASSSKSAGSSKPSSPAPSATLEPAQSDRGLTDLVLREALESGYADFVLLNGSFSHIMETRGRAALERAMERFWTRWAWEWGVGLEDGSGVCRTLQGFPSYTVSKKEIAELLDGYGNVTPTGLSPLIIGPTGPLTLSATPSLTRHFYHILTRTLPPRVLQSDPSGSSHSHSTSATTGKARVSSWNPFSKNSSWIPGAQSEPSTPVKAQTAHKSRETKSRWPSLGLGSVATGMGSVGAVFGLGSEKAQAPDEATQVSATGATARPEELPLPASPKAHAADVPEHTNINVDDLEEAIGEVGVSAEALTWETLRAWLSIGGQLQRVDIPWIIREDVLLALVPTSGDEIDASNLPGQASIDLISAFSKLIAASDSALSQSHGHKLSNGISTVTTIHSIPSQSLLEIHPAGASSSGVVDQELSELREMLRESDGPLEVLARTQDSKFLAAKSSDAPDGGEVFIVVNRSDSSIVDAEHALRLFAKTHSDFA